MRILPYPLSAAKLSLEINLFGFWLLPRFNYRKGLSELAKQSGEKIWYLRWAWFQLSFSRWV